MRVEGKVVLITGASSGIGLATARAFAAAGSQVVLVARTKQALDDLAVEINNAGGHAIAVSTDITDKSAVQSLVAKVEHDLGRLDVLINNAGIGINSPVPEMDPSDFEQVLAVNLLGPLYLIQATLPLMIAQGRGIIVNVLSISGRRAMPNSGGYCASKAALELLTDSLRMEVAMAGIKVVNVYPGFVLTPFGSHALGAKPRGRGRRFALSPHRVAQTIVKATRHERRDSYVTLFDRLAVAAARQFPALADWAMQRIWGLSRSKSSRPT